MSQELVASMQYAEVAPQGPRPRGGAEGPRSGARRPPGPAAGPYDRRHGEAAPGPSWRGRRPSRHRRRGSRPGGRGAGRLSRLARPLSGCARLRPCRGDAAQGSRPLPRKCRARGCGRRPFRAARTSWRGDHRLPGRHRPGAGQRRGLVVPCHRPAQERRHGGGDRRLPPGAGAMGRSRRHLQQSHRGADRDRRSGGALATAGHGSRPCPEASKPCRSRRCC